IFALDGDGLCNNVGAPIGCPFGPSGYEGPGVSFTPSSIFSGVASFTPAIPPGGSAYFSLEESISWGQLSAQLNRESDHFQCYRGRILTAQPPIAPVTVVDALTGFTAKVRKLRDLCTPTNKN